MRRAGSLWCAGWISRPSKHGVAASTATVLGVDHYADAGGLLRLLVEMAMFVSVQVENGELLALGRRSAALRKPWQSARVGPVQNRKKYRMKKSWLMVSVGAMLLARMRRHERQPGAWAWPRVHSLVACFP